MKNATVLLLVFPFVFNCLHAQEKRIALVIGNAAYTTAPLKNPVNDANLMATTLQGLGFEVIKKLNASKLQMEQAVQQFSEKLAASQVALFYYAGHGMQANGINYLIPTDAQLAKESDLKFKAVLDSFIVEGFQQYHTNSNIVILEAWRDNPLSSWAGGGARGFKAISPGNGTIIAFATTEGNTASDGEGANGLFTSKLVQQMKLAQPVESVFKNTRVEVLKASAGKQSPQEWSMLTGNFQFVKGTSLANNQLQETYLATQPGQRNEVVITEEVLTGNIRVTSETDGAFYLDGNMKGIFAKGRVYTLNNIEIGSHELKIGDWTKRVVVEADKTLEVKAMPDLPDRFADPRDGKIYKTVQIGNQLWMAENLNYYTSDSWCYDNNSSNCVTYGRLYTWETAKTVCPAGWHLPSDAEWSTLADYLGGADAAGGKLKETGTKHWSSLNPGADNGSGFTALPGGSRSGDGSFIYIGYYGFWWSSTEGSSSVAWNRHRYSSYTELYRYTDFWKGYGFSVRCLRD